MPPGIRPWRGMTALRKSTADVTPGAARESHAIRTPARPAMNEVKLLVITGAGASHELGADRPIPLMTTWAASLRKDLETALRGSSGVLGLEPEMSGQDFEAALGQFLQWQRAFPLNEKFRDFGGQTIGSRNGNILEWLANNEVRAKLVVETLHSNLYSNFGRKALSDDKTLTAWRKLDEAVGGRGTSKFFATTNYDPSLELAMKLLSYQANYGFQQTPFTTPRFDPSGIGEWSDDQSRVVVLHLHGAVGWYRDAQGTIVYHEPDLPYNPSLGIPVVLLPDPQKDPQSDAGVAMIWSELERAVGKSTHILVIGHSLHDDALVRLLLGAPNQQIGVLSPTPEETPPQVTARANMIPTRFGPNSDFSLVAKWLKSGRPE